MTNLYKKMVIRGQKKWTEVPELWREKVSAKLVEEGYTLNEDGTVTGNVES